VWNYHYLTEGKVLSFRGVKDKDYRTGDHGGRQVGNRGDLLDNEESPREPGNIRKKQKSITLRVVRVKRAVSSGVIHDQMGESKKKERTLQ